MSEDKNEGSPSKRSKVADQRDIPISAAWVPPERSAGNADSAASAARQSEDVFGGQLTGRVVDLIDSAKKTAVIVSFLLADKKVEDAIFKAAKRGVRVYLLLACETRLDKDPDDAFGKDCLEQHRQMLKRLAGKIMIRSAPHYHAKVILVDAIGTDEEVASGMMLTANLTKEALERNEELAVPLLDDEIKEMTSMLKWAFFEDAEHQMLDNSNFAPVDEKSQNVPFPDKLTNVLCTSKHNCSIKENALRLISEAQEDLMVSSFGWGEDHEVIEAICAKARAGVGVTILARKDRQASRSALIKLVKAGARVYGFKWLHAKAIWADANEAMVMSANLEKHGLDEGFELGVVLSGDRASAVKDALELFLSRKQKYKELKVGISRGDVRGEVEVWEGTSPSD